MNLWRTTKEEHFEIIYEIQENLGGTEDPLIMSYSRTQPQNIFFQINDFLTLRLEGGVTNIFINGVLFNQCKFLLFNIFGNTPEKYDIIESIDEAETVLDRRMKSRDRGGIDPYTEFWGHCSFKFQTIISLEALDLGGNKLRHLPLSITKLYNLRNLDLNNCYLENLLLHIINV